MWTLIVFYCVLEVITAAKPATPYYNILSIDGGGMKAVIPTRIIEHMELYARDEVIKVHPLLYPHFPKWAKTILSKKSELKMPMNLLFDMPAGTSSGNIVAGSLSYLEN